MRSEGELTRVVAVLHIDQRDSNLDRLLLTSHETGTDFDERSLVL